MPSRFRGALPPARRRSSAYGASPAEPSLVDSASSSIMAKSFRQQNQPSVQETWPGRLDGARQIPTFSGPTPLVNSIYKACRRIKRPHAVPASILFFKPFERTMEISFNDCLLAAKSVPKRSEYSFITSFEIRFILSTSSLIFWFFIYVPSNS